MKSKNPVDITQRKRGNHHTSIAPRRVPLLKSPNYNKFAKEHSEKHEKKQKCHYEKWRLPKFGVDKTQMGTKPLNGTKPDLCYEISSSNLGVILKTMCLTIWEDVYWMKK